MAARWALALWALAFAAGAAAVPPAAPPGGPPRPAGGGAPGGDGICELRGADRARTPSHRCTACHDGTAATSVAFSTRGNAGGSHPVGVDYDGAARPFARLKPRAAVPPTVPLVDGRVECTSCHDGASPRRARVANERDLCIVCHDL
jgi:predicted CXXCH cytochrome family protein